jgi:hypothetical protein
MKHHVYLIHTKMSLCLSSKTEDSNVNQVLLGCWYQWVGRDVRKGCRRVNMVYSLMYENGKMRPIETIPGMGGVKENDGGDEFNYDTL